MRHAFIDKYAQLDSPIHDLTSSFKIKSVLVLLGLLLLGSPLLGSGMIRFGFALYGCIILFVAVRSQVPLLFLLTRSALVLPFSGLIVVVNYVSGSFDFSHMILTLFKSLFSVFTLLLLTSTTPFHGILKQLSLWGTPKLFITTLTFMYRYFFLLIEEIEALERAIKMRHPAVSGWKRINIYANIIGMLLVRSFERAEKVYQAMQMRGFTGDLS